MKIRLLCENAVCDAVWQAEWGFSALIEYGGAQILFDSGYSDVWLRNAKIANVDLDKTDVIVLSHFHDDHTRGLLFHPFTNRHRIICHPRVLTDISHCDDPEVIQDYRNIRAKLKSDFDIETISEPMEVFQERSFWEKFRGSRPLNVVHFSTIPWKMTLPWRSELTRAPS